MRMVRRRGFVLPFVIMLVVVVGLAVTVMLSRDRVQNVAVQHQIEAYQVHHGVMGIWSVFEAWAANKNSDSITDFLDDDGYAFSIEPGDGTSIDIYLADGQGTLKNNADGLDEESATDLAAVYQALLDTVPFEDLDRVTRDVGPWQVSVKSAPHEVLTAVAMGIVEDDQAADRLASELILLSESDDDIGRADLNTAMASANVPSADRARINRILTVEPTLYRVRVGVRGTGVLAGRGIMKHYRALVTLRARASSVATGSKPSAPFLDWQEYPVQSYNVWPEQ